MAGWKDFREIAAWQHAEKSKIRVYTLLERPKIKRDFRLATQLREAARSAPANIAEGFGRFGNKEFARFARIAKGSLHESMNHLIDARDQRLITEDELLIEEHHIKKAINAVTGLIRHLETRREAAPGTKNPTEPNSEPGTGNA
jgi:four helix bundle protein